MIGRDTTVEEVDRFLNVLPRAMKNLRSIASVHLGDK